jgi:hypothetical protein
MRRFVRLCRYMSTNSPFLLIYKPNSRRVPRAGRMCLAQAGARRRRNGGGPGEGCARKPVGTYLYLHAVGACNPVAVPGVAR